MQTSRDSLAESPIDSTATPRVPATILAVDDSESNLVLVDGQLRALGHRVVLARNGRDALALVSADTDLVLMDLDMPELDGIETTRRLRARGCTTPIVALTATTSDAARAACRAAGMDGFLAKPIGTSALGNAIADLFSETGTRRTVGRATFDDATPPGDALADLVRDVGPEATVGLVEMFLVESVGRERALATAIADSDEDGFRRAAHTLASTTALVGGIDVEHLCRQAERAGLAATDTAEFAARLEATLTTLRVVLTERARLIAQLAA